MEQFTEFMDKNPHYGYLIVAGGFGFYLLGLIMNWKWTLEAGGGLFTIANWIETLGEKTVRVILGVVMLIAMVGCLAIFMYYDGLPPAQ